MIKEKLIKMLAKRVADPNCRLVVRKHGSEKVNYINLSKGWAKKVMNKLIIDPDIKEVHIEKKIKGEWIEE